MSSKIGIYPGTFDPIHDGHVAFAQEAMKSLSLDRVLFIPERVHQRKTNVTEFYKRLRQISDRLADTSAFEAVELVSVPQTMAAITKELPELFEDNQITMLIGSDNLCGLGDWVGIKDFLQHVQLCVGLRGDDTVDILMPYVTRLETKFGYPITCTFVTTEHKDVSSQKIRESPDYISL